MKQKSWTKTYIFITIAFTVLLIIPYIIRLISTPDGMQFNWFLYNDVDYDTYLNKINTYKYYKTVEYLPRFSYDKNITPVGFLFLFYTIPGLLCSKIGITNPEIIYNLLKLISIGVFFFSLYLFLKQIQDIKERSWILFMVLLFSGHEELLFFATSKSIVLEEFLHYPHHLFENSFILLSWLFAWKFEEHRWKYSCYNGILFLLISFIHPPVAVVNGLIEGIYLVYKTIKNKRPKKDLAPVVLWGVIPLPYLIYVLRTVQTNSTFTTWAEKNIHTMFYTEILAVLLIAIIIFVLAFTNMERFKKYDFIFFMPIVAILNLIPNSYQHYMIMGTVWSFYITFGIFLAHTNFKIFKKIIVLIIGLGYLFTLFVQPVVMRSETNKYVVYVPEYYQDIAENFEDIEEPVSILGTNIISTYLSSHTKHFIPFGGAKDESPNYKECASIINKIKETKSIQPVIEQGHIDYFVNTKDYQYDIQDGEEYIYKETDEWTIYKFHK